MKVSDYNLQGKTQTLTVTKILPPEAPLPATADGEESASSRCFGDSAGDRARKAAGSLESAESKRSKSG